MTGRIYAIDPGLTGTGWAEWRTGQGVPDRVGVFHHNAPHNSLAQKCWFIADQLRQVLRYKQIEVMENTHLFIEMPQQMASVKGLAAQGGAIYKLTFLVGYLACASESASVHEVTVGQWKGQLPKGVVQRRIERRLGLAACGRLGIKSHAWDAVGLGLWAIDNWKEWI